MQTIIKFIFVLLFLNGCAVSKNSFVKDLYIAQKRFKNCGINPSISFRNDKKIIEMLDFINFKNDTLYHLEAYYYETDTYFESFWTNEGKVEYIAEGDSINYVEKLFPSNLYFLIENWDTITIRKEEDRCKGNMVGGGIMVGSIIYLNNGNLSIDCIKFNEFGGLEW